MPQAVREKLLDGALAVLGKLDGYDEASAFAQVFDRLNQWSHAVAIAGGTAADEWKLDPLYETLPAELRAAATPEALGSSVFDARTDVESLRDQRWLADIAATARGDAIDDLDVAVNIFTWTVRSLAIASDPPMVPTAANPGTRWFLPGEILLAGRASGPQRAWVFLELLRHSGLDGVMLATGDAAAGTLRPWVPALLSGGEAYLFEPTYGMPVPGPGGQGVATARQAAADPAILRGLSLPDRAYPVQASDIGALSVLVPATPQSLSRRMHLLDGHLAGATTIDLTVAARPRAPNSSAATRRPRAACGSGSFPGKHSAAAAPTRPPWRLPRARSSRPCWSRSSRRAPRAAGRGGCCGRSTRRGCGSFAVISTGPMARSWLTWRPGLRPP